MIPCAQAFVCIVATVMLCKASNGSTKQLGLIDHILIASDCIIWLKVVTATHIEASVTQIVTTMSGS